MITDFAIHVHVVDFRGPGRQQPNLSLCPGLKPGFRAVQDLNQEGFKIGSSDGRRPAEGPSSSLSKLATGRPGNFGKAFKAFDPGMHQFIQYRTSDLRVDNRTSGSTIDIGPPGRLSIFRAGFRLKLRPDLVLREGPSETVPPFQKSGFRSIGLQAGCCSDFMMVP